MTTTVFVLLGQSEYDPELDARTDSGGDERFGLTMMGKPVPTEPTPVPVVEALDQTGERMACSYARAFRSPAPRDITFVGGPLSHHRR